MQVNRTQKSNHNDIISIEIESTDYLDNFEKKLKKYSKEADIKGFRKGSVPLGMVKKLYGVSIMAEEINHIADHALNNFVKENNIKLLGRPILAEEQEEIDIQPNEPKSYKIQFEIGYEPEYNIELTTCKLTDYEIKIVPEMITREIENIKNHFSKLEDSADPVADKDSIYFTFDNSQNLKGESFASTEDLTESGKTAFIGKKVGDAISGKALELFDNNKLDVKKHILSLKEDQAIGDDELNEKVLFTITNVKKKVSPEEFTPEQIKMITRDENKSTLDELKIQLEDDIKAQYKNVSQNYMRNDIYLHTIDNTKIDLPVDFLKKWIVSEKENKMTEEQVNSDFDKIEKSIKWDLITNKFATENELKVEIEEIRNDLRTQYSHWFMQSGMNPPAEQMEKYIDEALKDQKTVRKTYENLLDTKILDKMIEKATIKKVSFTEEEFVEESTKRNKSK